VLALAASGAFDAAFAGLPESPDATEKVWELAVNLAPDDAFLTHAVQEVGQPLPQLSDNLRQSLARRLLGLGLPDPAQNWLDGVAEVDPILAAQIALGQHDGRKALVALAGLEGDEAQALSLHALDLIGQDAPRAAALAKAEKPDAAALALARAGDWTALAQSDVETWKTLASQLAASPPSDAPIAHGHALVTAGEGTRAAVEALLASLPVPNSR
jgi:hypothetical protein